LPEKTDSSTRFEELFFVVVQEHFQIEPVSSRKHFLFNLLDSLYFRKSTYKDRFSIEIHPLSFFIAILYIIFSEVYFFRQKRYFIIIRQQVIGLFALKQRAEALYVSSLATSPLYRRMGVATCILNHALTVAGQLQKGALELSVLKTNTPALRLYKFGFRKKGEKRRSLTRDRCQETGSNVLARLRGLSPLIGPL
jgi:ribosomal protein S18 acetylase RimI-like enzyme